MHLSTYTSRGRGIRAKLSSSLGVVYKSKSQKNQPFNGVILKRYESTSNNASVSEIIILPSQPNDIYLVAKTDPLKKADFLNCSNRRLHIVVN